MLTSTPSSEVGAHVWPAVEREEAMENISLSNSVYLSYEDLANLTTESRLVIPWFNHSGARDVFPKMEQQPRLSQDSGWVTGGNDTRWDFTGSGKHSSISNDEPDEGYWRVFMTRSVDQFSINEEKEFRRFVDPDDLYRMGDDVVKTGGEVKLSEGHPTVAFRYVARNDDTRTMIATVLPEQGFMYCAGYIHAVAHEEGTSGNELLALLSYVNSFTCDWWLRRIVDRHVNAPMIDSLPLPDWDTEEINHAAKLSAELVRRNGTEVLPGGKEIPSNTGVENVDSEEIRSRIESVVARGFGLDEDNIDTVLSDFSQKACSEDFRDRIRELVVGNSMMTTAEQDDD